MSLKKTWHTTPLNKIFVKTQMISVSKIPVPYFPLSLIKNSEIVFMQYSHGKLHYYVAPFYLLLEFSNCLENINEKLCLSSNESMTFKMLLN